MVKEINKIKSKGSGANPIPGTVETVPGYPLKLKFFRVACSPYYWARVYVNGSYKIKSLKTENRKEAINFARKFYEDALVGARTGSFKVPKSRSFAQVGNAFIETLNGAGKPRRYSDDNNRYKKELIPFFGEKDIGEISNADIGALIKKLLLKGLSPSTVNHYIVVLRKILKYAADNRLIHHVPNFPKIHGKTTNVTKRDYFDQKEYKALTIAVDKLVDEGVVVRGVAVTIEMKHLIQFMVNSFIRPSDLRVLKHEHVKVMIRKDEPDLKYQKYLLLSHPATKTTDQEVVTMPVAHPIYEKLLDYQKKRGYSAKGDYLFLPEYLNRNTMMNILSRLFRAVVNKAGVSGEDEKYTLYSLRHSAIMYRLQLGKVNTLQLAKNCRTSQAMIEKYYASRLTNLMGVNELHSFKSVELQQQKKNESVVKK